MAADDKAAFFLLKFKIMLLKEIMTKEVVSVSPEMPLLEGAKILTDKNLNGVPVVDKENKLVGILTQYDLLSKGSAVHIPTFQMIFQNLALFKSDRSQFKEDIDKVSNLKVKDVMNDDPLTLKEDQAFKDAVIAFRDHHKVNPIPIVNKDNKLAGVISRHDIIKFFELFSEESGKLTDST